MHTKLFDFVDVRRSLFPLSLSVPIAKWAYAIFLSLVLRLRLILVPLSLSVCIFTSISRAMCSSVYLFQVNELAGWLAFWKQLTPFIIIYSRWTMRKYLHKQIANDKFSTKSACVLLLVCFRLCDAPILFFCSFSSLVFYVFLFGYSLNDLCDFCTLLF